MTLQSNQTELAQQFKRLAEGVRLVSLRLLKTIPYPILAVLQRTLTTAIGAGMVCALLSMWIHMKGVRNTTVSSSLILTVLGIAVKWGRLESIFSAIIAAVGYGIYFQPPIGSLYLQGSESWAAVAMFLVTAIVVSQLSLKARRRQAEALARKEETERLYMLGQALLGLDRFETVAWAVANQIVPIFGARSAAFFIKTSGAVHRAGATEVALDVNRLEECAESLKTIAVAAKTSTYIPVTLNGRPFGSIGIAGAHLSETVLNAIKDLLALVLERVESAEDLIKQHAEVDRQRQVSESLLLNILPPDIADELRTHGMVAPKYFEDVTIVFTDFVGFTLSTEKLAAEDLVENLHDYFTAFDRICERYRLEKLKTIGDSYMCISGLPVRNPAHPVDAVLAAFEMVHEVINRDLPGNPVRWKVRVGVHTGPVIAGVVGINKFAFDIWGDTVNFSSRMESSSQPNRINISERTYSRVKDFFECEYRGKVLTKEKREFDMYFANSLLPRLRFPTGAMPPPAFARRYGIYFGKELPAFPEFLANDSDPLRSECPRTLETTPA